MRRNLAERDNNLRLLKHYKHCEISRFRSGVYDVFALLVCYALNVGIVSYRRSAYGTHLQG